MTIAIEPIIHIAKQAGAKILELYHSGQPLEVAMKENKTPVTEADLAANEIIFKGLRALTPDIPVISEEAKTIPFEQRKNWTRFWLVDPLDGTKEFIHRTDDFTVNIALIEQNQPTIGCIYAPVFDLTYFAQTGQGAFKIEQNQAPVSIQTRNFKEEQTIIAVSRRHSQEAANRMIERLKDLTILRRGSSIKSCLIAEGLADLYPAFGPMSEWDIAAAQCIVAEAGGAVIDEHLQTMRYNVRQTLLNPRLLVVGDPKQAWQSYFKI